MKKQVKKLSKKILVLGLATSIIFTSCFSYKKINAHATSVAVGLGAYTLYEICLYIGGLAVTTLGIGYAYENRDEIAEFGKSVIDTMSDLPALGWVLGSHTTDGDYVYGTEALQEVKDTQWTVIQGGGQSPKNDNDDDGDEDLEDREMELNLNGYFLTSAGVNLFKNHIKPLYDNWVNSRDENGSISDSFLNDKFGYSFAPSFIPGQTLPLVGDVYKGYMVCYKMVNGNIVAENYEFNVKSSNEQPLLCGYLYRGEGSLEIRGISKSGVQSTYSVRNSTGSVVSVTADLNPPTADNVVFWIDANFPIFTSSSDRSSYLNDLILNNYINDKFNYHVADWIKEDNDWQGYLEDIATSLRSLQDLTAIAQALSEGALTTQPTADEYGDMMVNLGNEYAPKSDPISEPTYYPATNTTPKLDPIEIPNYVAPTVPDSGGTDNPSGDGTDEVPEIDLDGLLSIFNILFYLIMIIVMLIYLFLSCLAFIVMIFRIPASSTMLPEDMVLGYEHLKTIMIPGMNISIYGFAMALIYLFIIFAVIKLIRLEINDFKFPRSYK